MDPLIKLMNSFSFVVVVLSSTNKSIDVGRWFGCGILPLISIGKR